MCSNNMTSTFKTSIVHGAKPMTSSNHKWWPLSTHVTVLACAIVLQQILLTTMIYMYLQSNACSSGRLPNVLKGSIEAKRPKRYHPNNVFDKIYLLNLKADTKKLNVMKKKLGMYNIKYDIFEAIDGKSISNVPLLRYGNRGAVGTKQSQLAIVKDAIYRNYKKILILEDDIIFHKNFDENFNRQYENVLKVNPRWDLLYLGCSFKHKFQMPKDQNFFISAKGAYGNFAVGIDSRVFSDILMSAKDRRPIDDIFVEDIQRRKDRSSVVLIPMLITADIRKVSKTDGTNFNAGWYYSINGIDETSYDFDFVKEKDRSNLKQRCVNVFSECST